MAQSKKKQKAIDFYQKIANERREIKGLTATQYKHVLAKFWTFARSKGFYRTRKEAIDKNGYYVFQWQKEIAEAMLKSLFRQMNVELVISILRQVGKTETVGLAGAFIFENFYNTFKRPLDMAIIAPEKDTACVPFERVEKYMNKKYLIEDTKKRKRSIKGDSLKVFGIYDEYKGAGIEGNHFDLVIRDEAHKGDDKKFNDEVRPAMMARRGCMVLIGNGGYKKCEFKKAINRGNGVYKTKWGQTENILVKYTYKEAKPYFETLAGEGLDSAQLRLHNIETEIEKYGLEDREIRKNFFCEWIEGYENPVTQTDLDICKVTMPEWNPKKAKKQRRYLYMGVDFATLHDRSIATIMDEDRFIIDWLIIKDNNEIKNIRDQCDLLQELCDERGYTAQIIGIGYDATGVGSGGVNEFLEGTFASDLRPFTFSLKSKHEWYALAVESIKSKNIADRIKFDPEHEHAELFQQEWTEIEATWDENQKYKKWHAPNEKNKYDDMIASHVIVNNMVSADTQIFKNLRSFASRFKTKPKFNDGSLTTAGRYFGS